VRRSPAALSWAAALWAAAPWAAAAAVLTAAIMLPALPAVAAESALEPEAAFWRSTGHVHAHVTLPGGLAVAVVRKEHASPVVFVLPDAAWDTRRAWPYLDRLSLAGATVVELWSDEDRGLGLADARAAIASAVEALGPGPTRVALLGFGTGGRLALALAGPDRPAAALYPVCDGASAPDPGARVMVLHPDEASETRNCAALVAGRPGAQSGRATAGAGHAWDAVRGRGEGSVLLPHPAHPNTARRLPAYPDGRATFQAVRVVSDFLLGEVFGEAPARGRHADAGPNNSQAN
jgi:hypothetical protein